MAVAQVSAKGHVLIPRHLRKKFGLQAGTKVYVAEEEGRVVVMPLPSDPIAAATGFLAGNYSLTDDLRHEHRAEARRERKARSR